jgi:uncharacterized membrane protein
MARLRSVEITNALRSKWTWQTIGGFKTVWTADIIQDLPGSMIAWQTSDDASVEHSGSVFFRQAPGGRGTEVRFRMSYELPGGKVGDWLASIAGESPSQTIDEDLRKMKWLLEAGEIPTIEGQSRGSGGFFERRPVH